MVRVDRANGITRTQCRTRLLMIDVAICEARCKSASETLADVSTKTATATLVSDTFMRGSASASRIATNESTFKTSALRRAVRRHSYAIQTSGSHAIANTHARSNV